MAKRNSTTPFDTPEYWLSRARDERAFAAADRRVRFGGTAESIRVHLANADEYEKRAIELQERAK
jgi:hypothetical protein